MIDDRGGAQPWILGAFCYHAATHATLVRVAR
jgi:hypothetical protein